MAQFDHRYIVEPIINSDGTVTSKKYTEQEWKEYQQKKTNKTAVNNFNKAMKNLYGPSITKQMNTPIDMLEDEIPFAQNTKAYIVTFYDSTLELNVIKGVFSTEDEAQKYTERQTYPNMYDIEYYRIDSEVIADEIKEPEETDLSEEVAEGNPFGNWPEPDSVSYDQSSITYGTTINDSGNQAGSIPSITNYCGSRSC